MAEPVNLKFTTVSSETEPDVHSPRMSSRVTRGICFCFWRAAISCLAVLFVSGLFHYAVSAATDPPRPRILGIAGVTIAAPSDTEGFYTKKLGIAGGLNECMGICLSHLDLSSVQELNILDRERFDELTQKPTGNNLVQITFETSDLEALHSYLASRGLQPTEIFKTGSNGTNPLFWVVDPELHQIGFVQLKEPYHYNHSGKQVSGRLIHAGFVVHNRTAMDKFYKDILGFHVYWHGGMKDGVDDWVDMQVPDGTDWIEYMLNVPVNADKRTLGIMNHIALGIPDIHAAQIQLLKNGMQLSEEPKIGRDGKWQLNLYDLDQTRVELMEFTPTQKPCCSGYTGPHPQP